MSGNKLLMATLVLAVLSGITVWQFNVRDAEDQRASDVGIKLPKIKKDDVDELSIAAPDKKPVVLTKTDKKWALSEPLKAAADQSAVDTVLSKLEELEVIGLAATKADSHEKLEITDSKAVHVIAKQAGKPVADLLIGAYRSGNTMVREPKNDVVATVKGSIKYAFEKDLKDWRDRAIVDATTEQVTAVSFENDKGSLHFVKEGTDWKQAATDKPLPSFDGTKVGSIVGTVASLRANDFAAEGVTVDGAGVGTKSDGLVTLTSGGDAGEQQVILHIGHKQGDGYYLTREGKDAIYVVAAFAGERLLSGPEKFVKDEPKVADASKPAPGKNIPVEPIRVSPH